MHVRCDNQLKIGSDQGFGDIQCTGFECATLFALSTCRMNVIFFSFLNRVSVVYPLIREQWCFRFSSFIMQPHYLRKGHVILSQRFGARMDFLSSGHNKLIKWQLFPLRRFSDVPCMLTFSVGPIFGSKLHQLVPTTDQLRSCAEIQPSRLPFRQLLPSSRWLDEAPHYRGC